MQGRIWENVYKLAVCFLLSSSMAWGAADSSEWEYVHPRTTRRAFESWYGMGSPLLLTTKCRTMVCG